MIIEWPETEPIPQTVEEALASGWELDGSDCLHFSDDGRVQSGTWDLVKHVGMCGFFLKIPFRAELSYGKPHTPIACVDGACEEVPS